MAAEQSKRFENLRFDDFRRLARDDSLSPHEKVGFPDSYREGKRDVIFADILQKLSNLQKQNQTVVDLGPGCGELADLMLDHCRRMHHRLIMVDSQEVLDQLPDDSFVTKVAARFPVQAQALFEDHAGKVDAILCYDVIQVVFVDGNYIEFFDRALELLAPSGQLLLGDIPNVSKRKRFFASPAGVSFHKSFMQTEEEPAVSFNTPEPEQIDDAAMLGLIMRARAAGFDAYWLPQPPELPMANRREDLLVHKP